MTKNELRIRIAAALEIEPNRLKDDSSSLTISEWTSLGVLGILSVLDELTDGDVSPADAEGLKDFAAVVEFARRKGVLNE
jgi:acyl carrier protein